MAEKVKQLFLSKNYLVIDSVVDCRLVFNPQGDGTTGGDVLYLRGGRWSFRINDFLAGELLPDGSRENISGNGAGYSVNIVWNDEDGEEPDYYTTYRNPANISALDGQLVQISGSLPIVGFEDLTTSVTDIKNAVDNNIVNISDFTELIKDTVISDLPNIKDNVQLVKSNTNDLITNTSVIYNKVNDLLTALQDFQSSYKKRLFVISSPSDHTFELKVSGYHRVPQGALIISGGGIVYSLKTDAIVYQDGQALHCYSPCIRYDGTNLSEVLGFDLARISIGNVFC